MMKNVFSYIMVFIAGVMVISAQTKTESQIQKNASDSAVANSLQIDSSKVLKGVKFSSRDTVFIRHLQEPQTASLDSTIQRGKTTPAREKRMVDLIKTIDIYSVIEVFLLIAIASALFNIINRFVRNKAGKKFSNLFVRLFAFIKILIVISVVYLSITLLFGSSKEITFALLFLFLIFSGVALTPVLKNLFSGFSIRYTSLFDIGDYIKVDNYEGRVSKIGWRSTSLTGLDKSIIHLPNSLFFEKPIENINTGQIEHLVIYKISFPQDIEPSKILSLLKEAAISNPFTFQKKNVDVFFKEIDLLGKLNRFEVNFYIFDRQFESEAVSFLNESILSAFKSNNISL